MKWIGSFALYAALYISIVGIAISFVAGRTGSRRFVLASRFSAYAAFGAVATASSVLMHALLTHDFSIEYVAGFSDRSMPLFYLMASFWGGQAGSLLFWTSIVASFTALCVFVNRRSYQEFLPWVIATCLLVMTGLLMILCFVSDPFEGYAIIDDPTVGKGLNPLLQTPKMVVHPPSLLAGMATMTVPYGFAVAALMTKDFSNAWVEAARKWILVPWLFLSVGNMLGGMWAYEELGWGGYWAWDAVENAAFFPWLIVTALIHSIMIQERRGMLKRWNLALMLGAFLFTLFGTWLTRSGLIASVHTFAQSDIGAYFLALLVSLTVFSVALCAWRWPQIKDDQRLESALSREASFILNNYLLLTMTVVVLWGTLWPRIKEGVFGQEVSIGPPWFNDWMAPLGLLLLALMGVGTVISWRRASLKNFRRNFVRPILVALTLGPALLALYWFGRGQHLGVMPDPVEGIYAALCWILCVFAAATIVEEVARGVSARRRMHDEGAVEAIWRLVSKQRRRYGGYLVHLGIVCAFIAFAGNALKIERDVSLALGESVEVGDYRLTYTGLDQQNDREKLLFVATLEASRRGEPLGYAVQPGKAIFHASPNAPTSEIDIRSTPLEDLYVALVSFDSRDQRAAFTVFVAPFTWWFWFGGTLLMIGTLICMWPTRRSLASLRYVPGQALWRGAAALSLLAVSLAPGVLWTLETSTDWGNGSRLLPLIEADEDATVVDPAAVGAVAPEQPS